MKSIVLPKPKKVLIRISQNMPKGQAGAEGGRVEELDQPREERTEDDEQQEEGEPKKEEEDATNKKKERPKAVSLILQTYLELATSMGSSSSTWRSSCLPLAMSKALP